MPDRGRKCWAVSLGGCSTKMSNEHVLTKGVFSGTPLHWSGSGLKHFVGREIAPKDLQAKVLCAAHNCGLSNLDAAAIKLAAAMRALLATRAPRESSVRVDGWAIERWCLKAGHNLLASCWLEDRDFNPAPQMVQIIFGRTRLPDPAGLWVVKEPAAVLPADADRVAFKPFGPSETAIAGFYFLLHGIGLIVSSYLGDITKRLRALPPDANLGMDWGAAQLSHRPAAMRVFTRRNVWAPGEEAGLTVHFQWG